MGLRVGGVVALLDSAIGQQWEPVYDLGMPIKRVVAVGPDGTIAADASAADLLKEHAGRYRLVQSPPGLLVLERIEGDEPDSRVMMMGEVINQASVLELISMIANNGWRGELSIVDGATVRRLMLDQGALKSAFSNAASERLGEVMVSLGTITPDQLARCVLSVSPERRFGEIAIEQGFVDRHMLFEMLQAQAQRIFQGALLMTAGHYTFSVPSDDGDAPAMTVHMPVQGLLMESVQRIDEMALFRERIPDNDVKPRMTTASARISLDPTLQAVAMLCNGDRTLLDIGRDLRMDEFEVTKQVMQLLQIGYIELTQHKRVDRDTVEPILRQLNDVLREIRDTVERHGGRKDMLWTLKAWLHDSEISRYFGEDTRLDGDIPIDATLERLTALDLERPLEELHRAAHELVSFAMFAASPNLPREAERNLSKWVNQRIARLRL
jgi:hypothetical protein